MRLSILSGFCLIVILFAFKCRNARDKDKLKVIIPICDRRIFVEKYEISGGGAYGGDIISVYLTDSFNFRKYLATYDDSEEAFGFYCNHDSVTVYRKRRDSESSKLITVDSLQYDLTTLKKQKLFE